MLRDGAYFVTSDSSRIDLDAVVRFLNAAYWSRERTRETILRSIENSICFSLFEGDKQIGFARVISDRCTFAYLCDVFIDERSRGKGLGKFLMQAVTEHPDLQGLRRFILASRDAQHLYSKFGWTKLHAPERWMERFSGDG